MSDLIFLAVVAGFFALAVGLLRACEHIVGPDPAVSTATTPSATTEAEPVEASA